MKVYSLRSWWYKGMPIMKWWTEESLNYEMMKKDSLSWLSDFQFVINKHQDPSRRITKYVVELQKNPIKYENVNILLLSWSIKKSDIIENSTIDNYFFVSSKIKDVIWLDNSVWFKFYPIKVELERWYIMTFDNVPFIDCINEEKSEIIYQNNWNYLLIKRWFFDETLLKKYSVFRLKKKKNVLHVTEEFIKYLRKNWIKWFWFKYIWNTWDIDEIWEYIELR